MQCLGPACLLLSGIYFSHILKLKTRETRDQSAYLLFDLVLQSFKCCRYTQRSVFIYSVYWPRGCYIGTCSIKIAVHRMANCHFEHAGTQFYKCWVGYEGRGLIKVGPSTLKCIILSIITMLWLTVIKEDNGWCFGLLKHHNSSQSCLVFRPQELPDK